MKHFLLLFLLLKCTYSTSIDAENLIENLKNAIKTNNLSSILHPNFKLFSCRANLTKNLAQLEQTFKDVQSKEYLKFNDFEILQTYDNGADKHIKLNISSGQLISILTVRQNSQILFETHQNCRRPDDAPLTFSLVDTSFLTASSSILAHTQSSLSITSLIDYDATAIKIATQLFADYVASIRASSRRMFNDIVAATFSVSDCNHQRIMIKPEEYFYLFLATDKNIGIDETSIDKIEPDLVSGRIRFHVFVNRSISQDKIIFTAFNINNKYLLVDEHRPTCFTSSQRSQLSAHLTRRLQSLLDAHVAAINSRDVATTGYQIGDGVVFTGDYARFYPTPMPKLTVVDVNFDACKSWLSQDVAGDVTAVADATNIKFKVQFSGEKYMIIKEERQDPNWKINYEKKNE